MDLPGLWHIAVEISVRPAMSGGGRTEMVDNPDHFSRLPNMGFKHEDTTHTFITYMWISTPCNPAEVDGCRN